MSKKYFAILAIVILGISMSFGSSALAAMTYGATTATSDGNYTLDGITSSVVSLGPSVTTGSFAMGAGLTTGSVTIGGTSMAAGATTIYGGTGTGAISLTPGTAGTIQIGSAGSGAVTITPATTVTGLLTTTAGITSGSNIKSDTDSTDSLGLTGTRWASTFSDNFTGNTIALDGATGVNTLTITDAVADGLSIIRGSTDVIVINTSTPSVTITPATIITGALSANGGVDRSTAAALALGGTTASAVDIGKTGAATTIKGTFNVDEAATFDTTVGITGVTTVGGNIISDTDSTDSLGSTGVRWASTFSDAYTGNTIALDGATGVNTLTITDAVADGLSIIRGSTDVIVINTSTPSVTITPATTITGLLTTTAGITSGSNIVSDTDSTDSLGSTGVRWASTFSDAYTGNTIALDGATGVNTLTITDAVADGLSIIRGSTDVIVINTSTPSVTITPATIITGALSANGGVDRSTAAALALGGTNANAVDISKTGTATTIKGTFNVDEAATLDTTLGVTGITTFGNSATAGKLLGSGSTSAAPYASAFDVGATAGKAMSFYLKSSSQTASHVLEGLYINTYHGTDAAQPAPSGEAGRFRAYLTGDASGTVALVGSHSTVEMAAGSTNSGLTLGSRGNVIFPNEVVANAGTYAGAQAELNTGGAATDVSGTTTSILRLIIDGTAPTLPAQFTVPVFDVVLPANLVADDVIMDTDASNAVVGAKLRIRVNGTTYWLMLADASN